MDEDTMAAVDGLSERLERLGDRLNTVAAGLHREVGDREYDVEALSREVAELRRDLDNLPRGY